ncbi:unnamed protein product [Acanthoscelides obtectus]|uniref:Thioredoxin domain-containing protein n=1 Tax=Acanthoscelides obtectus TaxID=200917 RepID=A0A9P0PY24_ACAOB|nr:unnamed protein product [Acanthoscelides obtectus]CAK1667089.1 Thioredoxin-T [Acanthoscelides obtectus]
MVTAITHKDVLESRLDFAGDKLVVIEFYAHWCGPCKVVAPKFAEFAHEFPMLVLLKVDVDECEDIALKYNITSMPTYVFIRYKKVVTTFSGASAERLKRLTETLINKLGL